MAKHPADKPFASAVQTPVSTGPAWKLQGAILSINNVSSGMLVAELKERIQGECGLPPAKQNLSVDGIGFLKNTLSLAHHNVTPDDIIRLSIKERGGKK